MCFNIKIFYANKNLKRLDILYFIFLNYVYKSYFHFKVKITVNKKNGRYNPKFKRNLLNTMTIPLKDVL